MTFYSAGIFVKSGELSIDQVPGLQDLMSAVDQMTFLSSATRAVLTSALLPSVQHRYYEVDPKHFDAKILARLKAEFNKATGADVSEVDLYALTDIHERKTFLLPAFFELMRATERQAILFHEADWLIHPDATYGQIIASEQALQALLENPGDEAKILDFMDRIATPSDRIRFGLDSDLKTGALKGFFVDDKRLVRLVTLLGSDFATCKTGGPIDCSVFLIAHFREMLKIYPNSLFFKALRKDLVPATPKGLAKIWIFHKLDGRAYDLSYFRVDSLPLERAVVDLNPINNPSSHRFRFELIWWENIPNNFQLYLVGVEIK